jgi:hypothetical protein
MMGLRKVSARGGASVLRTEARSAAKQAVVHSGRTVCCGAALVVLMLFAGHMVEVTAKDGGEVLSLGWVVNVGSVYGYLMLFVVMGRLLVGSVGRNGVAVLGSLSVIRAIRKVGKRASLSRDGKLVRCCVGGCMWGVPVDLAVKAARGRAAVFVVGPHGDALLLEEWMWSSWECRMTLDGWRARVAALLWNAASMDEVGKTIVPEAWFASRNQLRLARQHVFYAVRSMEGGGLRMSLDGFARILEPDVLREVGESLPESRLGRAVDAYLQSITTGEEASLAAVVDRLRALL